MHISHLEWRTVSDGAFYKNEVRVNSSSIEVVRCFDACTKSLPGKKSRMSCCLSFWLTKRTLLSARTLCPSSLWSCYSKSCPSLIQCWSWGFWTTYYNLTWPWGPPCTPQRAGIHLHLVASRAASRPAQPGQLAILPFWRFS